jgi:hypothetical protein
MNKPDCLFWQGLTIFDLRRKEEFGEDFLNNEQGTRNFDLRRKEETFLVWFLFHSF